MARTPKSVEEARANFDVAITYIPDRYKRGVERAKWEIFAASDQAEKNFSDMMAKVIAGKKRQLGCKGKEADWKTGATTKGAAVIGGRIRDALDKYAKNFGDVYSKLLAILPTLPPRTIDPMANVDNRLKKVVDVLFKAGKRGRS